MAIIKCVDIVGMIVDEATKRFSPIMIEDSEKKETLNQYCNVIDNLIEEFDGDSIEVNVDEINMTISIKMFCDEITIETKSHPFYELIKRSLSVNFSYERKDNNMSVEFVFPSIWKKAW